MEGAYETVKLVESGQHVSWSIASAVQGDLVWIAEVIGVVVGEVDVASRIYVLTLTIPLHGKSRLRSSPWVNLTGA
jgi:hypothetical protein